MPGVDFRGVARGDAAAAAAPAPLPRRLPGESGDVARDGGADLLRGGETAGDAVPMRFFRFAFFASAAMKAAMFGLRYPPREATGRSTAPPEPPVRRMCNARPDERGFGELTRFFGDAADGEDAALIVDSSGFRSKVLLKSFGATGDTTARLNTLPGCGDPRL